MKYRRALLPISAALVAAYFVHLSIEAKRQNEKEDNAIEVIAKPLRKQDARTIYLLCKDKYKEKDQYRQSALIRVCNERDFDVRVGQASVEAELRILHASQRSSELDDCSIGLSRSRCEELFEALDCVDDFRTCAEEQGYIYPQSYDDGDSMDRDTFRGR